MKKIVLLILIVWIGVAGLSLAADKDSSQDQFQVYTVKKGDTLSEIAFALKISEADLIKWNSELGIRLIYPGQKIRWQKPVDKLGKTFDSFSKKLDKLEKSLAKEQKKIVPAESKPSPALLSSREELWVLVIIIALVICVWVFVIGNKMRKESIKSTEETSKKDKVEKALSDIGIVSYKVSSALGILGEKYEEEKKIICPFCAKEIMTKNFRRHILNRCQMITQEERSLIEKRLKGGLENDSKEA